MCTKTLVGGLKPWPQLLSTTGYIRRASKSASANIQTQSQNFGLTSWLWNGIGHLPFGTSAAGKAVPLLVDTVAVVDGDVVEVCVALSVFFPPPKNGHALMSPPARILGCPFGGVSGALAAAF